MTEAHIKEATKMLGWFFDRCGKVPHYKGMMYVKNADNLKALLDSVIVRIEKENSQQIEKTYDEEDSYTVHFKNGSHFSFVVVDTVSHELIMQVRLSSIAVNSRISYQM